MKRKAILEVEVECRDDVEPGDVADWVQWMAREYLDAGELIDEPLWTAAEVSLADVMTNRWDMDPNAEDRASSSSRQHFIDTGRYLTNAEVRDGVA